MTLQEKIERLVRYCGQYQSHGFMMDERNTDEFYVELPEEKHIRQQISQIRVILLTGEAGDGKSRILRNLDSFLKENGFEEPCRDFSALEESEKAMVIKRLKMVLEGQSSEKLVISANVGVFTQAVIQLSVDLMEELTSGRNDVYICNFENRNLAEDEVIFRTILKQFLEYEEECQKKDCPCFENCAYRANIEKLLSVDGGEGIRQICNAIYLIGGHVTFRELLSLLAYTVTFGQDCRERVAEVSNRGQMTIGKTFMSDKLEKKLYYHIFDESSDILLRKVSQMDPGLERGYVAAHSKEDYRNRLRKAFFEGEGEPYALLHIEYLREFYNVLQHINQPPYYYDTVTDRHPCLVQLKKGINKMSNQGKSDAGLIVTDTPAIFDKKIRLEFMVVEDMSMIWHRYDLQVGGKKPQEGKFWNKFYLSYQYKNKDIERKMISLLIDYNQFRYLMMCGDNYFMNRSGMNQEEYAVNTFYRRILSVRENAYQKVIVRFDDSPEEQTDFSLQIHSEEDFFTGDTNDTILIKRED